MSALLISVDLGYINEEKANDLRPEIAKIAAKINALCKAAM